MTEKEQVDAMIAQIEEWVRVRAGLADEARMPRLPEGLVIQMHPLARYAILRHTTPRYEPVMADQSRVLYGLPAEIPVRVDPELPPGAWRLAVVTTQVILEGRIDDTSEARPAEG